MGVWANALPQLRVAMIRAEISGIVPGVEILVPLKES